MRLMHPGAAIFWIIALVILWFLADEKHKVD